MFGLHKPRTHRSEQEAGQDPRPFLTRSAGAEHKELALPEPVLPRTLHRPVACHKAGSGYGQLGRTWKVRFWFHLLKVVYTRRKSLRLQNVVQLARNQFSLLFFLPTQPLRYPKKKKTFISGEGSLLCF